MENRYKTKYQMLLFALLAHSYCDIPGRKLRILMKKYHFFATMSIHLANWENCQIFSICEKYFTSMYLRLYIDFLRLPAISTAYEGVASLRNQNNSKVVTLHIATKDYDTYSLAFTYNQIIWSLIFYLAKT